MVATGIGSYSYLKYSEQGYNTGMSSSMTYTNDWFIVPFFMFGWLPILYLSRIRSIPEYFERRFNRLARYFAVVIILSYMFFYIGYNLFTIGVAIWVRPLNTCSAPESRIDSRINTAAALSIGRFPEPHLGECTHDGQPLRQGQP